MIVRNLIYFFVFILLAVGVATAGANDPNIENIEDRILIGSVNLTNYTFDMNEGFYITDDGQSLYFTNWTDVLKYDIPTPYYLDSVNLSEEPESFSLGINHQLIFFEPSGMHFYSAVVGIKSGTTTAGVLSHFVLTSAFDLSTATFSETLALPASGTSAPYAIGDVSINFLGSILYLSVGTADGGGDKRVARYQYQLNTPYYLTTKTLIFANESAIDSGGSYTNYQSNLFLTFSDSYYFDIWGTIGFHEENSYYGMESYNLSSSIKNKSFSIFTDNLRNLLILGDFVYTKLNHTIFQEVKPPIPFASIENQEMGINRERTINVRDCCFAFITNPTWDLTIQVADSEFFEIEAGESYLHNVSDVPIANFSLSIDKKLTIETFEVTYEYDVGIQACTGSICTNVPFLLSITDTTGINITGIPQNISLTINEIQSRDFDSYFDNYAESYVCATDLELLIEICALQNQSFTMYSEDDEPILNLSYDLDEGQIVTFKSNNLNGEFLIEYFACNSGFNCISQEFYLDITGEIIDVPPSGTGKGLLDSIDFIDNIFPDSGDLSLGQKSLYVVISMIVLITLVTVFGFIFREESGIASNGAVKIMGAFLMFLAFFFFIAIGYVSIGIVIAGVILFGGLIAMKLWKGGSSA